MTSDVVRATDAARVAAAATIERPMKLISRAFMHDPYPVLRALREVTPAVPVVNNGFRMWVVTRYEDARRILADPAFGKDVVKRRRAVVAQSMIRPERRARLAPRSRRSVLDRDGADHRRLRAVLGGMFSPSRLPGYRERLNQIISDVLDGLRVGETIDAIGQFARPLSATFAGELLGVPGDQRDGFPLWETDMLTAPTIDEIEAGGRNLYEFALTMIDLKRREPGDDLFTWLLRLREEARMDEDELASTFVMLLVAASEPTTALGNGLLLLLSHPEQLAAAKASDAAFGRCVDEILRYESPFRMLPPRLSHHPLELDGVTIPAGELILVSVAAANRDPLVYADPDRFDISRSAGGHLGFGFGPHRCLGAQLGRIETEIGLKSFIDRFPASKLAVSADQAEWRLGTFMRRLDNLPVHLG